MAVSWSIRTSPDAQLANSMLIDAIKTLNAAERPLIHSDRGFHYRWPKWIKIMEDAKTASVIIEILAKISAILAGPFLVFVTGCGIYCTVTTNWKSLIILAVIAGTVVLVYALIGIVLGLLDIAGSRIKWFIRP